MKNTDLIAAVGGIEKAQKIVDRAPDGAEFYSPLSLMWGYHKDVRDNTDASEIADGYTRIYDYFRDGGWWACACLPEHLSDLVKLDELRVAIVEHDNHWYGRSEEDELKAYALLSQEKIEGGAWLRGDFSKAYNVLNGALTNEGTRVSVLGDSDDVADISYHVSPSTRVSER